MPKHIVLLLFKVKIVRGEHKGNTGKVTQCYRKKWVIHIERQQIDKANGAQVFTGFDCSKVRIYVIFV